MTKQQVRTQDEQKKMQDSKVLMLEIIEKQTTRKEAEKFAQKVMR